jgi:hypothetical protein
MSAPITVLYYRYLVKTNGLMLVAHHPSKMARPANGSQNVSADADVAICVEGPQTAARRAATSAGWIPEAAADSPGMIYAAPPPACEHGFV